MDLISERRRAFKIAAQAVQPASQAVVSEIGRETRRKRGWIVAEKGGNISDFAHAEGVTSQTMTQWLKSNDRDLHDALRGATHPSTLPASKRLERLIAVRDGRAAGLRTIEIARQIGLSSNRLYFWLRKWAPDGLDLAIDDERFDCEDAA